MAMFAFRIIENPHENRGCSSNDPQHQRQYIAGFPLGVQHILQKIRQTIGEAAPGAPEAISYQMPTFKLHRNLVHFAAFKQHIGFYPVPSGIKAFKENLAGCANAERHLASSFNGLHCGHLRVVGKPNCQARTTFLGRVS